MKWFHLFLWDIRFQIKYGFYLLYAILTIVYIFILLAIPEAWLTKTTTILIFSDPAALGLFFMGAIILFEKNQHTPCAFAVSTIYTLDYIIAKILSLSFISIMVATLITITVKVSYLPFVIVGTAISSIVFTLLGILIATKVSSLNQFILWTVPVEFIAFTPAIFHLFGVTPKWLQYYPTSICIDFLLGKMPSLEKMIILLVLIICLLIASQKCVLKMWNSAGGVKL